MPAVEDALIHFFELAAQKEPALMTSIQQERRFSVAAERWCFTLQDLFTFLQHRDEVFNRMDYKEFRHALFGSPINRATRALGAEVIIADNRNNVDKSTYALVWTDA